MQEGRQSMLPIVATRTMLRLCVGVAAIVLWAQPARSQSRQSRLPATHTACVNAYRSALKLEQAGKLHDAQKQLIACGRAACGEFLHNQCTVRYSRIEAEMPSVVPVVTDAQ